MKTHSRRRGLFILLSMDGVKHSFIHLAEVRCDEEWEMGMCVSGREA